MDTQKTIYRAGLKRFNPKTEKNEFVPFEQLLKPNPNPKSTGESFVATKKGLVLHATLIAEGFTDEMIASLVERGHLHLPKGK